MKAQVYNPSTFSWLFEKLPEGFAYHRVVKDDNGQVVDYEFLACNEAFEKITGLRRGNIIGKRVTEVLPGIENSEFNWIEKYGEVAQTGRTFNFEQYSEPLAAWYEVSAYSEETGYFATVFKNITRRKYTEEKHREHEKYLEVLYENSPVSLLILDPDTGRILDANKKGLSIFGVSSVKEIEKNGFWLKSPYSFEDSLELIKKTTRKGPQKFEWKLKNHDGKTVWLEVQLNMITFDGRERVLSSAVDITEHKELEAQLRKKEIRYRALHDAHQDVICRWKTDTTLTYANPHYRKLFGIEGDASQYRWIDFLPEEEKEEVEEKLKNLVADPGNLTYEHRVVAANGEVHWFHWKDTPIFEDGDFIEFQSTGRDITKLKEVEQKLQEKNHKLEETQQRLRAVNRDLERLTRQDSLTELGNKRDFNQKYGQEWKRMRREEAPLSLVMFDIDYFKSYNDHYGHPAGDKVLHAIGQSIASGACRPGDCAARYGGEEFILVLPNTNSEGARKVAKKILSQIESLGLEHKFSDVAGVVTVSAGIAEGTPAEGDSMQQLIHEVDRALYSAKEEGRNRICIASDQPPTKNKRSV